MNKSFKWNKMVNIKIIVILLFSTFFSCQPQHKPKLEDSLIGVWSVKSIKWIYADTTYHLQKSQPGFLHFSKNRYSFIWTPTYNPRTPFRILSEPTSEEMQAGFRSIVLNAGTYLKNDSTIIHRAEIARVPGFEGGEQVFEYIIQNDTLTYTMVDETYPSGEKPKWFGKMKTEFVLIKID